MTAKTSEALAQELDKLHLTTLAEMARKDEFHDFFSPHAMPEILLVNLLHDAAQACPDAHKMIQIMNLRGRVINGDFDASKEESDEWAASPEGQETYRMLIKGE